MTTYEVLNLADTDNICWSAIKSPSMVNARVDMMNSLKNEKRTTACVTFPERLNIAAMEGQLSKAYRKTIDSQITQVELDLSDCKWCDLFSLSLLSLWIWELDSRKKQAVVTFPKDEKCRRFLHTYRFGEFLNSLPSSIISKRTEIHSAFLRPREVVAPTFPLTFVSEESLQSLLIELRDPNRLKVLLSGMDDSEIVSSGAFRNVVLKEIGDNIFRHGSGRAGHLLMTKISSFPIDMPRARSGKVEKFLYECLRSFAGTPVIQIAMGDKGPGYAPDLRDSYIKEHGLEQNADIAEEELLSYAFQYHSSRRSMAERLGSFLQHYVAGTAPPPTGLFQLRELVRKHAGLLLVRSGKSIVSHDFSDQAQPRVMRSDHQKVKLGLSEFGGVQYLIVIPTTRLVQENWPSLNKPLEIRSKDLASSTTEHVRVSNFVGSSAHGNLEQEGKGIFALLSEVDRVANKVRTKRKQVVVDFEGNDEISSKALYILLLEITRRQSHENCLLAIDANTQLLAALVPSPAPAWNSLNGVTLAFGHDTSPFAFRIQEDSGKLLGMRFSRPQRAMVSEAIFDVWKGLVSLLRNTIRQRLEVKICDPNTEILHKDAKVLLLSDGYSKGYFEVGRLFGSEQDASLVIRWIACHVVETEPELIVSLGGAMGAVMDKALKVSAASDGQLHIQHLNLRTDASGKIPQGKLLFVGAGKRVLVVGDVVGTARTMLATLKRLGHAQVVRVVALIDAREDSAVGELYAASQLCVDSLVRFPLKYFYELPPNWHYHEIYQVDPDTHALVRNLIPQLGPIWIGASEGNGASIRGTSEFLEKVLVPEEAYFHTHFTKASKHMTFVFDMHGIVAKHEQDIVGAIVDDMKKAEATRTEATRKTACCVVYPESSTGVDRVAKKVASNYRNATTRSISDGELSSLYDQFGRPFEDKSVVVIDGATDSGNTLLRLIDAVERMGASRVYGYVLVTRGSAFSSRKLEQIKLYGAASVHVRYLADAQLPCYVRESCPLCRRRQRLSGLAERLGTKSLVGNRLMENIELLGEETAYPSESANQLPELQTNRRSRPPAQSYAIVIRHLLALVEVYTDVRHEFTEKLRAVKKNHEFVLTLFHVMRHEDLLPTNPAQVSPRLFYSSFVEEILNAATYLLSDMLEELTGEQIADVFLVAEAFQERFIVEQIEAVVRMHPFRERIVSTLAVAMLESRFCQENPGIAAAVCGRIFGEQGTAAEKDANVVFDELVHFWQKVSEERAQRDTQRLDAFRDLCGGRSHDLDHKYRRLLDALEVRNYLDARAYWTDYRRNLLDLLSRVRIVLSVGTPADISTLIDEKAGGLQRLVRSIDLSLKVDSDLPPFPTEVAAPEGLVGLIAETMKVWSAIAADLKALRSNLKEVVYKALQIAGSDFEKAGICAKREHPDDACFIFGDPETIGVAIDNLLTNVCRWSKCRNVLIEITSDKSGRAFALRVLDDGVGPQSDHVPGVGLRGVLDSARRYCGSFRFDQLQADDSRFAEGYRTLAELELHAISAREGAQ